MTWRFRYEVNCWRYGRKMSFLYRSSNRNKIAKKRPTRGVDSCALCFRHTVDVTFIAYLHCRAEVSTPQALFVGLVLVSSHVLQGLKPLYTETSAIVCYSAALSSSRKILLLHVKVLLNYHWFAERPSGFGSALPSPAASIRTYTALPAARRSFFYGYFYVFCF